MVTYFESKTSDSVYCSSLHLYSLLAMAWANNLFIHQFQCQAAAVRLKMVPTNHSPLINSISLSSFAPNFSCLSGISYCLCLAVDL